MRYTIVILSVILLNIPVRGEDVAYTPNTQVSCDVIPTGMHAVYNIGLYTCEKRYYLPANAEKCVYCPSSGNCDGETFAFNPNEFQGLVLSNIGDTADKLCADNFPSNMYAIYQINTYTCSAGQYLPADGVACVQCPANSYCVGGTYTYSETTPQGITACGSGTRSPAGSSSASQCIPFYTCSSGQYLQKNTTTCASCPTGYTCNGGTYNFDANNDQGLTANNISLIWQDDNGNAINSGTCSYGEAISLPTTPTKTGYTFAGWQVVSN